MKFKKTSMIGLSLGLLITLGATAVFAASAPEAKSAAVTYMAKFEVDTSNMSAASAEAMAIVPFDEKDMQPVTAEEYAKQVEETKAQAAKEVADGELSQEEADALIASMEKTLVAIQNGEMMVYQSGNMVISYSNTVQEDVTNGKFDIEVIPKAVVSVE